MSKKFGYCYRCGTSYDGHTGNCLSTACGASKHDHGEKKAMVVGLRALMVFPRRRIDELVKDYFDPVSYGYDGWVSVCEQMMRLSMRRGWVAEVERGQDLLKLKWARRMTRAGYLLVIDALSGKKVVRKVSQPPPSVERPSKPQMVRYNAQRR